MAKQIAGSLGSESLGSVLVELDGGKPWRAALGVSFWAGSLGSESLSSVLVWN